jgi:hypothetical protein
MISIEEKWFFWPDLIEGHLESHLGVRQVIQVRSLLGWVLSENKSGSETEGGGGLYLKNAPFIGLFAVFRQVTLKFYPASSLLSRLSR